MFTTLVESRAVRPRTGRGALMSVLLHGSVIAGAVAMTHPGRVDARSEPTEKPPVYVAAPRMPERPPLPVDSRQEEVHHTPPALPATTIIVPAIVPLTLPPIDLSGPVLPPDRIVIGGPALPTGTSTGTVTPSELTSGAVVDVNAVERVPRILGSAPPPRYPVALRESGVAGRVLVRFVIDTLGRAELDGAVVTETTHTLFSDAVKNVLGLYRFSPGSIGGRKVRTMVQLPFTFTLRP